MLRSILVAALLALPASAQPGPDPELTQTINAQINAFRANDYTTAFSFASDAIRDIFGSEDRFASMVRQGYPMVQNPADVRFLEVRVISGRLWQKVLVTDASGATHLLDYNMVQDSDGNWRINAVQLLANPGVGA